MAKTSSRLNHRSVAPSLRIIGRFVRNDHEAGELVVYDSHEIPLSSAQFEALVWAVALAKRRSDGAFHLRDLASRLGIEEEAARKRLYSLQEAVRQLAGSESIFENLDRGWRRLVVPPSSVEWDRDRLLNHRLEAVSKAARFMCENEPVVSE